MTPTCWTDPNLLADAALATAPDASRDLTPAHAEAIQGLLDVLVAGIVPTASEHLYIRNQRPAAGADAARHAQTLAELDDFQQRTSAAAQRNSQDASHGPLGGGGRGTSTDDVRGDAAGGVVSAPRESGTPGGL